MCLAKSMLMNKQLNVFIADEDEIVTTSLKNDLKREFGSNLNITVFDDAKECLEKIDDNTHLVILAYDFQKRPGAENGLSILKFIKKTHPLTEVVMHSSNDDIRVILQSLKTGAKEYILKEPGSFSKVKTIIRKRFTEPIHKIITEFGVNKFIIIFLSTFVIMGVITWLAIYKHF